MIPFGHIVRKGKVILLVLFVLLSVKSAHAETIIPTASITLDGNPSDWSSIDPVCTDAQGDDNTDYTGADIKSFKFAQNSDYIYIMADFYDGVPNEVLGQKEPFAYQFHFAYAGTSGGLLSNYIDSLGIFYDESKWDINYLSLMDGVSGSLTGSSIAVDSVIELQIPKNKLPDSFDFCLQIGTGLGIDAVLGDITEWKTLYREALPENQSPVADAREDRSALSGQVVYFDGTNSYDPDGTIVSYQWDFGDGDTAEGQFVNHRFRGASGTSRIYTVTLTVKDDKDAIGTDTVRITVSPLVKSVEVSYEPAVPIGGPAFAIMTASYNWIHDDTYVVSKILYECDRFLGIGTISIWDLHSHLIPKPIWAKNVFSFQKVKTYHPKLSTILYGGDTFEGIVVDAFDAMNVYIEGWAGVSFSEYPTVPPPFFVTSSACFQPDYTEVPHLPIETLNWDLLHLASPGELRVYDSQGRTTGLVNGEIKAEIPDSARGDNTVIILSPSDSYTYEIVGTGQGTYSLRVASVPPIENQEIKATIFIATDIPISPDAIHDYTIDWDALSRGEEGVTVQMDNNGDGTFELTFTTGTTLVSMTSFLIDHAKLDFKKKPDDDKVRVQGKLELDLVNGDGVDISEEVIVTVGPLSETITMVEKGKKDEKWEYKRPKDSEGDIKHMKINWKKGEFDIRMDKADLTGITNPVTISIQIGDDFGDETIMMTVKKDKWEYKRPKDSKASIVEEGIVQPKFGLSQNYPNPCNPETTIEFGIAEDRHVTLKIYNIAGQLIKTLVDEYQTAGHYAITWYGDTDTGGEVASGVYFYRVKAGDKAAIKKMVVLK